MKGIVRDFGGTIAIAVAALVCAYFMEADSGPIAGLTAAMVVAMLGFLETALSFESAAVNARVLKGMSLFGRRMFIAAGVLVAILGMRFVFPLLIVWVVSDHGFWALVSMIVRNTMDFREILQDQFILVAGFGGAFLCMAFTQFFLDRGKKEHWIQCLERPMVNIGKIKPIGVIITIIISYIFSTQIQNERGHVFLSAAMLGIVTYLLIEIVTVFVQFNWDSCSSENTQANKFGITSSMDFTSLLYLVLLGTSLSFNVVIGAFSLADNLFIILLGLGVGAIFIQLLSVKLIAEIAPHTYKYLKHGVYWANGVMSLGLYLQAIESMIPELLIGTVGTGFIGSSFVSSLVHKGTDKGRS